MKGQWSDARLKAFIISGLRACSRRYPPKFETLAEAKTEKRINPKTKRLAQFYRCNICSNEFPSTEIQVDHINPVVDPVKGFVDWNTYIARMFCEKVNLQAVCKACHKKKTKQENESSLSTKVLKPKKVLSNSTARSKKKNSI